MHAHYLSVIADLLDNLGIENAMHSLLADTGVGDKQLDKTLTLSATQFDAVCERALTLSGDPQFGLQVGSRLNIPSQGIFGYALMSSATIGDALKLLVRYNRAILPSTHISLKPGEQSFEVELHAPLVREELARFYVDLLFAAIGKSGRSIIGNRLISIDVELEIGPELDPTIYHKVLGPSIQFGSPRNALRFPKESLLIPISTSNPLVRDVFRRECDRLLPRDNNRSMVRERVQQVLLLAGSQFPTSASVAKQLNMSESTLQRRLSKEGWRYQQVLDQVRYKLAQEYLQQTALPVAEVAALLGFSDATNFRRSFRRWSGTTPSLIRTRVSESAA